VAYFVAQGVAAQRLPVAVEEVLVGRALRPGVRRPLVTGRVPCRLGCAEVVGDQRRTRRHVVGRSLDSQPRVDVVLRRGVVDVLDDRPS
jgi:hypothetical protein